MNQGQNIAPKTASFLIIWSNSKSQLPKIFIVNSSQKNIWSLSRKQNMVDKLSTVLSSKFQTRFNFIEGIKNYTRTIKSTTLLNKPRQNQRSLSPIDLKETWNLDLNVDNCKSVEEIDFLSFKCYNLNQNIDIKQIKQENQ